jgi:RNA polymerase sigma factor (sigma-70 family)
MAQKPLAAVLRRLRHLVGGREAQAESDGQLLERFAAAHDEAAFGELMRRHGPLVLSVCRRILHDSNDVDDAFQATFVVLVRRAAGLRQEGSLASWLYGVAYRVALKARSQSARRRSREQQAEPMALQEFSNEANGAGEPISQVACRELRAVLDDEVNRLPEKYRAPLVLCYLQGKTNEQAAEELGWPSGSMSTRLTRARELLRQRLSGRGVALSAGAFTTALGAQAATGAVPATLQNTTLHAVGVLIAGSAAVEALSAEVAALADSVLQGMAAAKLRFTVAVVLALAVVGSGAGVLTYRALGREGATTALPADQALANWVDQRIRDWEPTPAERKIDQIGWAKSLLDARRLAQEHRRPIFVFTHDGRINTGRSGGSAYGFRKSSLSDDRVIALLNRAFVPVYSSKDDHLPGGTASAEEKAERLRIYYATHDAKLDFGDECVYILTSDGQPFDGIRGRIAKDPDALIERLEQAVRKLGTTSGPPVAPIVSQCPPPAAEPGGLVLHLTARMFVHEGWWAIPAENWLVFSPTDQGELLPTSAVTVGTAWDVPEAAAMRLLAHFYPASENNDLSSHRLEQQSLRGRVLAVQDGLARARIDGTLRMMYQFYPKREPYERVDAKIAGVLEFDVRTRRIVSLRLATEEANYGSRPFGVAVRSLP